MPSPRIYFHFMIPAGMLRRRTRLKKYLAGMIRKNGRPLERLDYIFCNDNYLLSLNRKFMKHDTLTDIISFPLSEPGKPLQGEIYISVDRIRDNALQYGISAGHEIHRVIFHGLLHLLGHDDKTPKQKAEMRGLEAQCLDSYFRKGST